MKLPLREFGDVIAALKGPGSGGHEKRQTARMAVTAKIEAHLLIEGKPSRSYSALTRDISLTGVGLLQSVALPSGQEVILVLPRPSPKPPLFVCCHAMHCRSLADGLIAAGMEFARIADEATSKQLLGNESENEARIQRLVLQ